MSRIRVCPECGQYNGHFAGCPEDVLPDAGPDDDEGDEQPDETPDEFQAMANVKDAPRGGL